jgi:succinyl-CoA synthetase alpha subunit
MGHAGAIIVQGRGTFESKIAAFEDAGVKVVHTPKDVMMAMKASLNGKKR